MTREEAKKHLCGGCTGTHTSGDDIRYFSSECKGEALLCQRITDFLRGYEVAKKE